MDTKHKIDSLCAMVIAAPDGSQELMTASAELRAALTEHIQHLHRQLDHLRQKDFPGPEEL